MHLMPDAIVVFVQRFRRFHCYYWWVPKKLTKSGNEMVPTEGFFQILSQSKQEKLIRIEQTENDVKK